MRRSSKVVHVFGVMTRAPKKQNPVGNPHPAGVFCVQVSPTTVS